MKALVTIPIETYKALLGRCSMLSREYLILKNGIIQPNSKSSSDGATVEILCEVQRAKFLFDFATLVCPEAAPYIEKSLNEATDEMTNNPIQKG